VPVIESPCVKICVLDATAGICRGCGRTLYEIERWTKLTDVERRKIIDELPARLRAQQGAGSADR
jgi:uncharacterized protein